MGKESGTPVRRPAKPGFEWRAGCWKVRFKKQDEPGNTARLFRATRGAVLVEHGGHRVTRVREVTLGGEEPRRTDALGERLLKAEAMGEEVAVLAGNGLRFFHPVSFGASDLIEVDRLAGDLSVSPGGRRCYVGSARFTQVVDRARGPIGTLDGVSLPRMALRVDSDPTAGRDVELWVHPQERSLRLIEFGEDGRPEVVEATEVSALSELEALLRVGAGGPVFALGKAKALDSMPFPGGPIDRTLERISLSSMGIERPAIVAHTHVLELLGLDARGFLVALDAPGKTHVQLRDPVTLEPQGSRAFSKNGAYTLATLVGPSSLVAFRRWEKLDRLLLVDWGGAELPNEIRVADARSSEDA